MKPILISCIPLLALAVFPCGAAEQQMGAAEQGAIAAPAAPELSLEQAEARVKEALRNTRDAAAARIAVSSHASTLILTGTVPSEADLARIRTAAEAAAGNIRVSSQIEVDTSKDAAAASKSAQLVNAVEAALRHDGATANLQLFVSMDDNQRILLSGLVPTSQARTAAQRVATSVPGVTRVDNRLTVPGTP